MHLRPSRTVVTPLALLLATTALAPAYAGDAPAAPTPAAAAAAPAAEPPAAPAAADGASDDIVVTARYKNETLQSVPIAITALSAAQIGAIGGQTSIKNLANFAPSVTIQGFSGRNQTITIRGLGTNSGGTNDGLDQGVGLYIDGVYRPRTGTVINDLLDVDSVQVLRGPQGTLFGKNTVAGAIDVRTKLPSFTPEVSTDLTYGNYNYMRAQASISGGLTDTLALRVSGLVASRDGTIYNTTQKQDWDDYTNVAAKADLLWKPSDTLSFRLIADYARQSGNMGFYVSGQVLPTTLANGASAKGFYAHAADVGYTPIAINPYNRQTDINGSQAIAMPSGGVTARVDATILGGHTLTSITAGRFWKWIPNWDGDQFGADVLGQATVATDQKQFSQELRLTSPSGHTLEYTAGLYYFYQKADLKQEVSFGRDAAKWYLGAAAPSALLNGLDTFSYLNPSTNSYAAYGQATWHVAPGTSLTGGLRYTYETKAGSYNAVNVGTVAPISSLPLAYQASAAAIRASFAPDGGAYSASRSKGTVSWLLSANQDIGDDVHAYASYSRGYKSAGINLVRKSAGINIFVEPEKVDSYEIGVKTQLFDRHVQFNTALFWAIDQNYQANLYDVSNRISYLGNAGKVQSRGVEVDLRATLAKGLSLSGSGSFTDAKYIRYTNAICPFLQSYKTSCDISGQRLSGTSKWVGAVQAHYEAPLSETLVGYVAGDASYRSKFYSAVNDDPFSEIKGYALVGAQLGVRAARGTWDVSLWGRNLLNKNYLVTSTVNATWGITQVGLGDPRTYGITLRNRF
ncbi:TonB-dependent receptor [Sphingomonas glacialis]|uniref:TonB-dependent receptor n=1 Tax=Sphingomonas glacialis TaxID=658225 RepID=A0A502G0F2_9SPHN|nr:TonB-dependent receptor [Sphingomonas glacialis]TPG54603.1 TonB-dependent receptor [Sphingomonas glacialis]